MTKIVVQLRDILVSGNEAPILNVPRFSVGAGETVALIGPNGAGKTTLLHVAALLNRPDQGAVAIHGETANGENASRLRRNLSVVFQDPLLFAVSVLANAAAGARFHGRSRVEAEHLAQRWLDRFGVGHLAERKARVLSGGEAARVALARAFATEPGVLLLDEPFSALDAPTRAALIPALRSQLRETGASAILVTHDLEESFAFADRIDLMDGGRIIASGTAHELIARPPSRRAAELLGIETILEGRIVRFDGRCALLALHPCAPLVRIRSQEGDQTPSRDAVTFAIPASGMSIVHPDEEPYADWNRLPGIVSAATPLPSGQRLVVETPAPFVIAAPWRPFQREWAIGDKAIVTFAPESGHVIREPS